MHVDMPSAAGLRSFKQAICSRTMQGLIRIVSAATPILGYTPCSFREEGAYFSSKSFALSCVRTIVHCRVYQAQTTWLTLIALAFLASSLAAAPFTNNPS